jgi:hypothetical protein
VQSSDSTDMFYSLLTFYGDFSCSDITEKLGFSPTYSYEKENNGKKNSLWQFWICEKNSQIIKYESPNKAVLELLNKLTPMQREINEVCKNVKNVFQLISLDKTRSNGQMFLSSESISSLSKFVFNVDLDI